MRGVKFDKNKTRYDLFTYEALDQIASVLTKGATKYSPRNWEAGIHYSRIFSALMRHLWKWWWGENTDSESQMSHLAHAACCVLFLLTYEVRKMDKFDDRPRNTTYYMGK